MMSGYRRPQVLVGLWVGMALALPVVADTCKVIDPELQESYQGGCRHGLAQGKGVARGTAVYEGGFNAGLKQGKGDKYWASGDRYVGEFRDDKKHGAGEYIWGAHSKWAGERYQGQYRDDRREGWGVYSWPNGDRYEGPWERDRRLGLSVMELRRQQASAAQKEGLAPGTKVCWLGSAPQPEVGAPRGAVEAFEQGIVVVRLSGAEGGQPAVAARLIGQVVRDAPENWAPCL